MPTNPARVVAVFTNGHEYTVRHRLPLMQHLQHEGWTVVGVAPNHSPAHATFEELGFSVSSVSLSRAGTNPFLELGALWSTVRCYKRLRPVLAIHATIKPVLYGTIAARLMSVPTVNLITGLGFAYTGTSPRARLTRAVTSTMYRAVFRYRKQRVVFQNRDDRDQIHKATGLPAARSIVVPGSGVDLAHFSPELLAETPDPEALLVILPARMLFDKGVVDFVEAAAILRPRFPQARFALVGPADEHNPAGIPLDLLEGWKERGEVEWWGPIPDIRQAYAGAAVVVLPSRREGMPKVVLEAAACGLPVVTTMVPGCRESVIDESTGFLVPHGDGPTLAGRIGELLSSAELRREFGCNARRLAEERFAAPKIVEKITDAAMEIL